jgi:hypothetical protein
MLLIVLITNLFLKVKILVIWLFCVLRRSLVWQITKQGALEVALP